MSLSVGLDIGTHHVRAVVLRPGKDGPQVVGHAEVSRRSEDGLERPLGTVVAELAAIVPLSAPVACASSELEVLARFITVAPLPPDRLQRLLRLELGPEEDGQPIPAMDAVRLATTGDDPVFLGLVAETGSVQMLLSELARAGCRPLSVSWGPLALAAAAQRLPLPDEQLALVVDLGANGSDVALVGAGRVLACRRLGVGGELFTQALIEAGLTPSRAEKAKLDGDYARSAPGQPPPAATASGGSGDDGELRLDLGDEIVAEQVPSPGQTTVAMAGLSLGPQMTRAAETLYGQLTTTIAFFKAQLKTGQLAVSRVYICGGGSRLVALDEYLSRRFQVPVERWDPFQGLVGAPPEPSQAYARAFGLALVGCSDVPRADLRPLATLKRELWFRRLLWPWIAAACLLAAGLIGWLGISAHVEADRAEAVSLERAAAEHARLGAELKALEEDRDKLNKDLGAIAGRIYSARDMLLTVQALKDLTREHQQVWITLLSTTSKDDGNAAAPEPVGDRTAPERHKLVASTAGNGVRIDSLVNRGAVDLYGYIKFDVKKTETEMVRFRNLYQQALQEWKTPEGRLLFKDVLWQSGIPRHFKGRQPAGEVGDFSFFFRCSYPPVHLEAVPVDAPAPEAAP